jgi:threonine dehydratase
MRRATSARPARVHNGSRSKQLTETEKPVSQSGLNREEIIRTYGVIQPFVRRTPVIEMDGVDYGLGDCRVLFKLEFLQHAGSFKARGAFANLILRQVPSAGVVAASGGNHGVAVAYAAMRLGKQARIFVPRVASPAKLARIRECGAELVVTGERYADALAASQNWAAESGALQIHAFDQMETLLGQGTVGLEFEQQVQRPVDTLLVAVGGGGLIGGIAAWYAGKIRLVGVEPETAPTLTRAAGGRKASRGPGGGHRSGFTCAEASGRLDVPDCATPCGAGCFSAGRGNLSRAGNALEYGPYRDGTRRRRGVCGPAPRSL